MKIPTRRRLVATVLGGLVVGLVAVVGLAGAAGVPDTGPCPASWFPLNTQPPAIQKQCAAARDQAIANGLATAQARPRPNAPPPTPDPRFPGVHLDVVPQWATVVHADSQGLQGIMGLPWNITSVWDDGVVPSPNHRGYALISVYAIGPHERSGAVPDIPQPQIARLFWPEGDQSALQPMAPQYNSRWVCPRAVGSITITAITGPNGVVSFTSTSGVSGTLVLATGAWTFSQ
jgi:hypothetical protein